MPQVRLIGLVLFITTVFLAMAAAATQTTHIRFKKPTRDANGDPIAPWQTAPPQQPSPQLHNTQLPDSQPDSQLPGSLPSAAVPTEATSLGSESPLQFIAIPVIYPLTIAGGVGLLMWFVPAPLSATASSGKNRRRRRRN